MGTNREKIIFHLNQTIAKGGNEVFIKELTKKRETIINREQVNKG